MTARRPKSPASRRPHLEQLEGRDLMAVTHLVLDFTPDYRNGSLVDTFNNTRYSNGTAPAFLDMNNDQRITNQDVTLAAGYIRNEIAAKYANVATGYDVRVEYNDVLTNDNFGYKYLKYGRYYGNQEVAVMYFGGRNIGEFGRAPLAARGYNVEGYGQVYTQAIANYFLQNGNGQTTPSQFLWTISAAACHELGHMLGLQHARNTYPNDMMNPAVSLMPSKSVFTNVTQYGEDGNYLNEYTELRRSFAGQPQYYATYNGGVPIEAPDGPVAKPTSLSRRAAVNNGDDVVLGFVNDGSAAKSRLEQVAAAWAGSLAGFGPNAPLFHQLGAEPNAGSTVVTPRQKANAVHHAIPKVEVATPRATRHDLALASLVGEGENC